MKKKIFIKGMKVHDIGYRLFLMNSAEDLGIENFDAKNIKQDGKQCVKVLIESSEDNVNRFIDFAKDKENRPEHANVDSVDIQDYTDEIKSFESFRTGFMAEQQYKFVNVGHGMLNEMKGVKTETKGMRTEMHEFRTESGENFARLNTGVAEVKNETKGMRTEMHEFRTESGENFARLNTGVAEVKNETKGMRTEMNENFRHLDMKYDKISDTMKDILASMDNTSKKTEKILETLTAQQENFTQAVNGLTKAILALAKSKS
ncbi:hypothetical protein BEH94_10220 [Candidatus Altiarchaeales archaeon WOR_SM1_SCG]|nr:hypothetical protein BEH94_10220 [Candidatus Altiarchaeales archaeon WOR_SM1_SCG]